MQFINESNLLVMIIEYITLTFRRHLQGLDKNIS